MNTLQNKIALITGGTSGIGAATAKRFKAEGATVIVTGSSTTSVEAARKELPGVEVIVSDAGDAAAAKKLVDHVKQKYGHIDILFVNAGIAKMGPSGQVEEDQFDQLFNVNVKGPFFLLKHSVPIMVDGGSIILTSAIASTMGMQGVTVYSATKAALSSFGRTFATELAPRHIRVNTITPGAIDTPMPAKVGISAEKLAGMAKRVPLGRVGDVEEIAAAALYFASDESKFTTGTELRIDGGMTLAN